MTDDVSAISRRSHIAILDSGVVVPITNWLDGGGNECAPADAVACVAGADAVGWFVVDLAKFDAVAVN